VEIGVSCLITSARYTRCVMRGLNPRLHQKKPLIRQAMDCPVKPCNDGGEWPSRLTSSSSRDL
jgi:hypothetical protein